MQFLVPEHTRHVIPDLDYDAIATADINLMLAWQVLKDESCPKCGTPVWIGHNNDRLIQFEIRETLCYACEAVDEHEEKERKAHDNKLGAGSIYYPVSFMADKSELPTREIGLKRVSEMEKEEYGEPGEKSQ